MTTWLQGTNTRRENESNEQGQHDEDIEESSEEEEDEEEEKEEPLRLEPKEGLLVDFSDDKPTQNGTTTPTANKKSSSGLSGSYGAIGGVTTSETKPSTTTAGEWDDWATDWGWGSSNKNN